MNYNLSVLGVKRHDLVSLEKINNIKSLYSFLMLSLITVILIFLSIKMLEMKYFKYFIFINFFLIAGRIGAFLNLMHEASHNILFSNDFFNNFVAKWFLGFPIGIIFSDYTKRHLYHHAHTTTIKEPESDADKYKVVNYKDSEFIKLILLDLIGYSAIKVFFSIGEKNVKKPDKFFMFFNLISISLVQFIIFFLVFKFHIINYLIFWIYPIVGPHMLLMRIRGIAEHGLSKQLNLQVQNVQEGLFYTRSFLTPSNKYKSKLIFFIEKILVGSFNVNYHHEHHICPKIPHYNLINLHYKLSKNITRLNKNVFEKGYLSAVFKYEK